MTGPEVFVVALLLAGLAVGSFINVVVTRLPRMLETAWHAECRELLDETPAGEAERFDLIRPPSTCPTCGHRIPAHENIPVVSYLLLRGRCSACGWRIPMRYPVVEVCGALIAGVAAVHFGPGVAAAGACLLGWGLLALGAIDLETGLLPDSITMPLLWSGLAFNLVDTFAPLGACVIGAIGGYLALWAVYHGFKRLTGREGMGHGDFKLLGLLGAWLGWEALPTVLALGSLAGATVGVARIASGRASRDAPLAFGPYLAGAGLLVLYCGDIVSTIRANGYPTGAT